MEKSVCIAMQASPNKPVLQKKRIATPPLGWLVIAVAAIHCQAAGAAPTLQNAQGIGGVPLAWWVWPLLLFITTFFIGIVAVLGGVGGGVLFVPIVGSLFPFHLDFVRGAGLFVSLTSALTASPKLLQTNLAHVRLALPAALIASMFSIVGALLGLALPVRAVQTALGITVILVFVVFVAAGRTETATPVGDRLSKILRIGGSYYETSSGATVEWAVHRTPLGLFLFTFVGMVAGMFGLGAGWANVPILNLVMGSPIKVAVATSLFLLSVTDTSAAWVYLHRGAVLPIMAVPSILGMMLGACIGVRLLVYAKPKVVRQVVLAMLLAAGVRSLLKGLGVWG